MTVDEAVAALYQASLAAFVAERKRLAAELKAEGDKTGAKALTAMAKPPISAWVVNQLYWRDRAGFEALLATAERLRVGELAATSAHRDTLARLKRKASGILEADAHGASEDVLRRVTATLNALAASGGFDPDPPGALTADRAPPGFDALALPLASAPAPRREDQAAKVEAERERERVEAELAKQAEIRRVERKWRQARLAAAQEDLERREAEVGALTQRLQAARAAADAARAHVAERAQALAEVGD